jgi:hypothetical protein
MEKGYTLEEGRKGDSREQWVEGLPKRSIWFGGLDTSGQRILPVQTYRCVRCGYLESYALPEELGEA